MHKKCIIKIVAFILALLCVCVVAYGCNKDKGDSSPKIKGLGDGGVQTPPAQGPVKDPEPWGGSN